MAVSESVIRAVGILALCMLQVIGFIDTPSGTPVPVLTSLAEPPLRIASFNIQVFGQTKYSKPNVRDVLIKVGLLKQSYIDHIFWC